MEIVWFGHACCALKNDITTIITDPFDSSLGLKLPPLEADIVTVSHDNPRHNAVDMVGGSFKVVNRPGEYEIRDIFIQGQALFPAKAKGAEAVQARNIVFVYYIEEITICHLGDIAQVPTQSQMEALDNIDILLIPIGGGNSLNATQAAEVISLIQPSIIIPIHYALPGISIILDPLEKFLQEMGQSQVEAQSRLRIRQVDLPIETQIVVLKPTLE